MNPDVQTVSDLFGALDLTLTLRRVVTLDEDGQQSRGWNCTLARPDGRTLDLTGISFIEVDEGEVWEVEPTPTQVLALLTDEDEEVAADTDPFAEAIAFLDLDTFELLQRLVEEADGDEADEE
jgi:hypothetical protein